MNWMSMFVTGGMKAHPRAIQGTKHTWGKKPSAFVASVSFTLPQSVVQHASFFWPSSDIGGKYDQIVWESSV